MTIYAHRLLNADIEIATERADKSAMGAINRPLQVFGFIYCSPSIVFLTLSTCHSERSEESLKMLLNKGAIPV
jgi:hypothetical protein